MDRSEVNSVSNMDKFLMVKGARANDKNKKLNVSVQTRRNGQSCVSTFFNNWFLGPSLVYSLTCVD